VIKRYTLPKMGRLWTLRKKFSLWLKVELAVIKARENLGEYPTGTYKRIKQAAWFTVRAIEKRDKEIEHDLQAFVDVVRSYLPPELQAKFHDLITSYDDEDPALAMLMLAALDNIVKSVDTLIESLTKLASQHMWTYCMGVTHGQDGEVITYAGRLCVYIDGLVTSAATLEFIRDQLAATKCSGAMGNYGSISPELEAEVCKILKLKVRPAASQIVLRDAIARFMCEIAILGSVLEKMALDNYILGQTAYREVIEPRKKKQKGSSHMPHKKNTILNERVRGMARILRGNTDPAIEDVATPLERAIEQSSVERIILPDSTILIHYMLNLMTKIVSGMDVRREQMAQNIGRTHGCWASGAVKGVLGDEGFDPEEVYRFVQECAFAAMEQGRPLLDILLETKFPGKRKSLRELIDPAKIEACFDYKSALVRNMPVVYKRNGLDESLALEPNC